MQKKELAYIVAELLELPRHKRHGEAYRTVQAFQTAIVNGLLRGERVRIAGFGIFEIVERRPRKVGAYYFYGKQGKHWEVIQLPSKKIVKFKPSKALLRFINGSSQQAGN